MASLARSARRSAARLARLLGRRPAPAPTTAKRAAARPARRPGPSHAGVQPPMTPLLGYQRLVQALREQPGGKVARPTEGTVHRVTTRAALVRARSVMAEQLAEGVPPPQALVAGVRAITHRRRYGEADALAASFADVPGMATASRAALAVVPVFRGRYADAAEHLRHVPRADAIELVPTELVAVEFATDPAAAVATADALLASGLGADGVLEVARTAFGRGEVDLADRALQRLAAVGDTDEKVTVAVRDDARWLAEWVAQARSDRTAEPVPEGQVSFAVLDYKQPDLRQVSANVGDYVQTLASIGHLVRHQDVRFHGDLAEEMVRLQSRVRPERRLSGVDADVRVLRVNRDASSLDVVPEGTWLLAFGWYMHSWYRIKWDFPFHPNLRPVFVSFHVNHQESLQGDSLDYLRRNAPVGCRDWTTVHLLLEHGVPAFFSGCLTTTVDTLFPGGRTATDDLPVALVDLVAGTEPTGVSGPTVTVHHSGIGVRGTGFVTNLRLAVKVLESYRRDVSSVVTSRLHCYLPVRALGVPVDFRPKNPDDIRFDGLAGISDEAFAAMQEGLRTKLEAVMTAILGGEDEAAVRKVWAEVCAADVAEAERRHAALRS
jgi:hypothetical protein